jgi:hypothetical protein
VSKSVTLQPAAPSIAARQQASSLGVPSSSAVSLSAAPEDFVYSTLVALQVGCCTTCHAAAHPLWSVHAHMHACMYGLGARFTSTWCIFRGRLVIYKLYVMLCYI